MFNTNCRIDYRLEQHPTAIPIPIAIWEFRENKHFRCVAVLKGKDIKATLDEAEVMLKALRSTCV